MKHIQTLSIAFLLTFFVGSVAAQSEMTREEYITQYKDLAIEHMDIYGIPASIKMAQGLLESANGNSRLAREANNHFGIKCKTTWKGETISHDDDAKGECFRKYSSVTDSYKDHSDFLDQSPRYQALFKLDPMDYKGWAKELKRAGYATNPLYAEHLIKIIEENKLYLLDQGEELPDGKGIMPVPKPEAKPQQQATTEQEAPADKIDIDNYTISIQKQGGKHAVYNNNGSQFVVSTQGDSYGTIAAEQRISLKKILSYNDLDSETELLPNQMVYIKAKNKRSENGKLIHMAKDGETMHSISQEYGIRLKNLCNINRRDKDSPIRSGQQIRLM